jgi:hypothetical protein
MYNYENMWPFRLSYCFVSGANRLRLIRFSPEETSRSPLPGSGQPPVQFGKGPFIEVNYEGRYQKSGNIG